ncbi:hypothetical protein NPIL_102051 [Nephila pilipes]|uniref:Uncharacterized protein n=1 Tax=Nephila pilipes TaxID=299642 RepID=A0A8X6UHN2_NEPPI|nr:hypothetical protein NPIL_102051 [Nephila pilipes]
MFLALQLENTGIDESEMVQPKKPVLMLHAIIKIRAEEAVGSMISKLSTQAELLDSPGRNNFLCSKFKRFASFRIRNKIAFFSMKNTGVSA